MLRLMIIVIAIGWIRANNKDNVNIFCTNTEMKLTLFTTYPFYGRMYAPSSSSNCYMNGVGGNETHLTLPLHNSNCGVVKLDEESYVAIVAVQHHPLVEQYGDKAYRLVCNLGLTDYKVTSAFNTILEPRARNNEIVDSTSPSPNIRLRILRADGNDVMDAKLGELLTLRVEMDGNSVFNLSPKGLIASSGRSDEHMELLDEDGCPTENGMFPGLENLPNSKILQGSFRAFKFSDDVVVRFHMNVQFCATQCPTVDCKELKESRQITRRDVWPESGVGQANKDPFLPLQKEIIVDSTDGHNSPLSLPYNAEEEFVCVSKPVFIAIVVIFIIVQICVVVTSVVCIWVSKNYKSDDTDSLHSNHMLIEPQSGDAIFYTDSARTRM